MGRLYLTFFHLLILKDSPYALPDTLVASGMGIWDIHLSLHMPAWAEIVYLFPLPICWLDSKLLDVQDGHVFVFLKLRTAPRVGNSVDTWNELIFNFLVLKSIAANTFGKGCCMWLLHDYVNKTVTLKINEKVNFYLFTVLCSTTSMLLSVKVKLQ